jgi:hypothetical protein
MLDCGRSIAETKGHHKAFIMALAGPKSYLPLVVLFYIHLVEGISKIKIGDDH